MGQPAADPAAAAALLVRGKVKGLQGSLHPAHLLLLLLPGVLLLLPGLLASQVTEVPTTALHLLPCLLLLLLAAPAVLLLLVLLPLLLGVLLLLLLLLGWHPLQVQARSLVEVL
jgi:hypothetical protein